MPGEPLAVHPLTFVRQSRGWGKAEFARLMQMHGKLLGIPLATNRTTVWKWEQGQEPDADTQRILADLLHVPYEQVQAEAWPRWLPVWEVTGLTAPWTEAGTVEALADLVGSGRMDRRGFLTITGAALTGLAASWAEAPSAFASALNGDRVTDTMVSTIEQRISTLRTLDDQLGGARLLEQARGDLALITGLLDAGRYTDKIRIRLYALAARVSHLTGWMAYDAGLRSVGQRYYVGALRSARTAADDAFGAFVLAEMGVHVSEAGRTAERVDLISTAIDNAPRTLSPYTQSFLYLHKAEALSRDGEHKRASRALNRAASLWERHIGEEGPDWLNWFGEAQLKSTEGKVLLRSGQLERATSSLEISVTKAAPRDKAVRSSRLAEARLAGNDLDGALDAANYGAELLEDKVSSVRALDRLKEFSEQLQAHKSVPAVREFRERLQALPVAS
ncbi:MULTISPECIES: transcriptional regulator [unclassified Streptomyces]|uniref:transcriptional regulator n=1 Tax=unclassified Streptomyces TaxID=2593676 RepID=UPI002365395A|nr:MULTISPECIES: transcriptional regulator [unclassified Streptomyces]MDF3141586.1 transcriptional regulator [Streptomyces sp. T21Q-yed]WDF38399.1 transcriptional regulator [Streptomyces sp. T12]